jgi:DNA-binding transcriptional regulator YbjK
MQVLCYHLFNNQLSQQVNLDLWEKALASSLNDLGAGVFENWHKEASPEEAKVLRAIAEVESQVSIKGVHELFGQKKTKISEKNIAKYLQRLVDKQLVERAVRGQYSIPDAMFRAYLRQRVPF